MPNQYVNKVVNGESGDVIIDLTADTLISANQLQSGIVAHARSGATITGTNTADADTSDANATASQILSGATAYVQGSKVTGSMTNNGAVSGTISTKAQQYTVPAGYHDGSGKVQIATAEQNKIIAGNIKQGVTVLGVTGTYSGEGVNLQSKSVTPSFTAQTVTADAGYDALESVQINAITQTNLTAANIKSGTTVTISNGNGNLWSVLGTYSGGGGSSSIDTKTATNSDDRATSLAFSSMKGQPIAFFLRCTSQLTRSSSYSYYYITDMRYNGTNTTGNYYRRSNGTFYNDASHYSFSYSGTTLTISSSASRGAAGGSFYNGSYELVYIY